MIKRIFLSAVLVLPLVMTGSQGIPAKALPENNEIEGWIKLRSLRHYAGENLYEYINGGAEIYHEFGFVQVVVQDYVNTAGKSVSVEIYQMTSPSSAFGMYTFKTGSTGKKIPIGNSAQLADYYMNFWQGPFLITLTGFDETQETRAGLLDIAKGISPKIPGGGDKPIIVSFLPEENLTAQSFKYFTGFLGLRNSHPFFSLDITGFAEGIKGDYSGGYSLFLLRFEDDTECQNEFERIMGQKDRRGRNLFMATHREYLMLVLGDVDSVRAKQGFDRVVQKIQDND